MPASSHPHESIRNMTTEPTWQKSTYCAGGDCLEVAQDGSEGGSVYIRDSKTPDTEPLRFSPSAWKDFAWAADAGEFGS